MFSEIFYAEAKKRGDHDVLIQELGQTEPLIHQFEEEAAYQEAFSKFLTAITKTERYKRFIAEKIEKGERASSLMGNLYTASIFLSLILTFIVAILWHTSGTRAFLCQICATRLSKRYKNTQFTFQHEQPSTC